MLLRFSICAYLFIALSVITANGQLIMHILGPLASYLQQEAPHIEFPTPTTLGSEVPTTTVLTNDINDDSVGKPPFVLENALGVQQTKFPPKFERFFVLPSAQKGESVTDPGAEVRPPGSLAGAKLTGPVAAADLTVLEPRARLNQNSAFRVDNVPGQHQFGVPNLGLVNTGQPQDPRAASPLAPWLHQQPPQQQTQFAFNPNPNILPDQKPNSGQDQQRVPFPVQQPRLDRPRINNAQGPQNGAPIQNQFPTGFANQGFQNGSPNLGLIHNGPQNVDIQNGAQNHGQNQNGLSNVNSIQRGSPSLSTGQQGQGTNQFGVPNLRPVGGQSQTQNGVPNEGQFGNLNNGPHVGQRQNGPPFQGQPTFTVQGQFPNIPPAQNQIQGAFPNQNQNGFQAQGAFPNQIRKDIPNQSQNHNGPTSQFQTQHGNPAMTQPQKDNPGQPVPRKDPPVQEQSPTVTPANSTPDSPRSVPPEIASVPPAPKFDFQTPEPTISTPSSDATPTHQPAPPVVSQADPKSIDKNNRDFLKSARRLQFSDDTLQHQVQSRVQSNGQKTNNQQHS